MQYRSRFILLAFLSTACNLVLDIVDLSGEDLGAGGANGGANPTGGGGNVPGGGGAAGGGGSCAACDDRVEWAAGWGSAFDDSGLRVAILPGGAMAVVGEMAGPIDFDDTRTGSIFVLGFDAAGKLAFSVSFDNCTAPSVAVGAQFRVIVAGSYSDAPSFNPGLSGPGAFVLSLNPMTGAVEEQTAFGGDVQATAVATDADGNVAVVGGFSGDVEFADWGQRTSSGSGSDTFVAKLTSSLDGAAGMWPRIAGAGGTLLNFASAVTFSGTDDIVVVGRKAGTNVDFGGGTLAAGTGMFLARLSSSTGAAVFVPNARADSVDGLSPGRVVVGGYAPADASFVIKTVNKGNGFVVSFDFADLVEPTQGVQWVDELVGVTDDPVVVAGGVEGDVVGAATFLTSLELGGRTVSGIGGKDIMLARLDGETGAAEWAEAFGSANDDSPRGIEVSSAIALTGAYRGPFDFGAFPLEHEGVADIFVARLTP